MAFIRSLERPAVRRIVTTTIFGVAALLATGLADPAAAAHRKESARIETAVGRPAGEPLVAIVSLARQRVTIYDAEGWILRAPVSSGQAGYETPAGIYSVIQKEAEHTSNLYDDASMPFMQRITWSGIALHAGKLPGYPASHGCVRMPYDFAERLFGLTKLGMRVIIARGDLHPAEIEHPLLFEPKPARSQGEADASLTAPPPTLKSIAAAKAAEAASAVRKANATRLAAARLAGEAERLVSVAESAKFRAEAQLTAAERALEIAILPGQVRQAEEAKARVLARLAEAEARLDSAKADTPAKLEAVERAREEAQTAEAEKVAALAASREATRMSAPISVLISRKTQRLYVRQAFQQVLESPVTIRDADEPIGTHIFTALDYKSGGTALRWNVISMDAKADSDPFESTHKPRRRDDREVEPAAPDTSPAKEALDRIEIPKDIADRISVLVSPGSALIVSDERMSGETGKDTDFVVLMSGEPQGGIKMRHHIPQAHEHYARSEHQYARDDRPPPRTYGRYERAYERPPRYPPPFFWGGWGGAFGPSW